MLSFLSLLWKYALDVHPVGPCDCPRALLAPIKATKGMDGGLG